MVSPFFTPGTHSQSDTLGLVHLRRDSTIPTILRAYDDEGLGYEEGKVTNTRFGSFPHSTLINQPWGSQIIASKVDTGSRGRKKPTAEPGKQQQLKRKAGELDLPSVTDDVPSSPRVIVAAESGFAHLLYPTPEAWTASLPHRTQVVYTPDYSYILHRLRVRPGATILEAGAGSGSFTHAAARAVFNGYPAVGNDGVEPASKQPRRGKVCSFEFHAQRVEKVREEIQQHGLEGIVEVTHRDVYQDGFLLRQSTTRAGTSPKANAIFLDLPAPWLALKHLVRNPPDGAESPLDPASPVYICTFSPCLEQVQRTISTLRQWSWLSIEMVEVNHRRIEVRRERCGLDAEGIRGAVVFPKSVDEAVNKLRALERAKWLRASQQQQQQQQQQTPSGDDNMPNEGGHQDSPAANHGHTEFVGMSAPNTDVATVSPAQSQIPAYKQGRLVHRTESDLKTHTSYLIFAVLPSDWTEKDERKCREAWPPSDLIDPAQELKAKSKKQLKRETKRQKNEDAREQMDLEKSAGSIEDATTENA